MSTVEALLVVALGAFIFFIGQKAYVKYKAKKEAEQK